MRLSNPITISAVTTLLVLQTLGCSQQQTSALPTVNSSFESTAELASPAKKSTTSQASTSSSSTITVAHFKKMLTSSSKLPQAVSYLKKNIKKVTPSTGTLLVLTLENAQNKYLDAWTDQYTESIQKKLMNMYTSTGVYGDEKIEDMIKRTTDPALKKLLSNTKNSGYQIINVEGYYMPIIDYDQYDAYDDYVTKDINDYVDIMAEESDEPALMDAGLVIGWDKLLVRTLDMEQFMLKYPHSNRLSVIQQNYSYAVYTVFYGADNTPLFDSTSKTIDPDAKKQYLDLLSDTDTAEDYPSSTLLSDLHGLMDLAAQSNYKLTSKLEAYRAQVAPLEL
ncbi:pectate lyase [Paenibacillus sp. SORGH_AS306]|uniref:hypothetical protein n=1 Tax=unclassified Paenibacillus TaxID=185978 RepID=UPI00278A7F26|nr:MULTISPECIES: hypothetical protein [unclassified Paenibacillus]MDQ1232575.1 pectate lyase [Paenibacillus sp. SORGH_AS_0306]MDR6109626.1 pectate lyase [Paenibacillus sp. SORGH_AS_0338]